MVLNTDPAQVRFTPVLFPSASAQKIRGPRLVVIVVAVVLTTLKLDLRMISLKRPVLVMFAPIERSLDAPVEVKYVDPVLVITPEVVTVAPVTETFPVAVAVPIVDKSDGEVISTFRPELISPVPVLIVEDALLITTSSKALIVEAVLVKLPEAPVAKNDTLLVEDVTAALTVCAPPR
jgi:hypothetical protein